MPVVDVRNIPTVVEFAPEHKVVEFNEETVTAEVVVGPTVVEFSWGELVPGPGLRGGGVFEGTVHIDQDIPSLPNNSEPIDPNADYIMLWDASRNLHVKVLAAFGGGGGGDGGDGGDGGCGGCGGNVCEDAPDVDFVGSAVLACGDTVYTTPGTDVPTAQAGDLAVWVLMQSPGAGAGGVAQRASLPTGWSWLIQPTSNGGEMVGVCFKFLEAADLTTTFSSTKGGEYINAFCSRLFVYRNVHPEYPFGGVSVQQNAEPITTIGGYGNPVPVFATNHKVLSIWAASEVTTAYDAWPTDSALVPTGPTTFDVNYKLKLASTGGPGDRHFDLTTYSASIASDENLFPGETLSATVVADQWTATRVNRAARTTEPVQTLWASNVNGTHYLEKEMTLVAGQKYTYAMMLRYGTGSSGYLTIEGPDTNERGSEFGRYGSVNWKMNESTHLDPLSDRGSVWHSWFYGGKEDGDPSVTGGWCIIHFTAQESGVHKFRLRISSGYGGTMSFVGDGAHSIGVRHAFLARGYVTPHLVQTSTGAVTGGTETRRAQTRGWMRLPFQDDNRAPIHHAYHIAINPAWPTLPLARLNASQLGQNDATANDREAADGLTASYETLSSDDAPGHIAVDKLIWPTRDGVAGKYYFEVTIEQYVVAQAISIGVMPLSSLPQTVDLASNGAGYSIRLDGYISTPEGYLTPITAPTNTVGDVWGVAVDYAAKEVKFYQNGTLYHTIAMLDGGSSSFTTDTPMRATVMVNRASGSSHKVSLNLRGPFDQTPPVGFVAYDVDGDPNAAAGAQPVMNTGDGEPIGSLVTYGTCQSVTLKSLVAGSNITLTSDADTITISAAGGGGGGGGATGPDTPPSSPDAMDDEFDATSLDAKWSWANQGSSSVSFPESSTLLLTRPALSGDNTSSIIQPISGAAWKIRAKIAIQPTTASDGADYMGGGLLIRNSTGSKNIVFGPFFASSWRMYADKRTDTSYSGAGVTLASATWYPHWSLWQYLEVELLGGALYLRQSLNGVQYRSVMTENVATYLGAITHVGLFGFIGNSTIGITTAVDWFRKVA